jgi:hypothetical protein
MLRLVVNNSSAVEKLDGITCRNSCELFDEITETCSIKKNVNIDSSFETKRCGHYLPKNVTSKLPTRFSLIQEDDEYLLEDENIFHELIGSKNITNESNYPLQPDFPSKREDATWFISPCGTYGCWIINNYKKKFLPVSGDGNVEMGWNKRVYQSIIPLHDHKSSLSLASRMAWIVDEEGYGQYALLLNGKISSLSSTRPPNWKKTY